MKAVLISIRPEWVDLIACDMKTLEMRKTHPKLPTPFKCYIYCTKHAGVTLHAHGKPNKYINSGWYGKIIGEFICNRIFPTNPIDLTSEELEQMTFGSCLSLLEVLEYYQSKRGKASDPYIYGWLIDNLKIYDRPKELSEFYKEDAQELIVQHSTMCNAEYPPALTREPYQINRAPQSWCYVEELENE